MRFTILCGAVVGAGALVAGQTPAPAPASRWPAFEVASIKPTAPGTRGASFGARPGGRWTMSNRSIGTLIRAAYPTQVRDLFGAPGWVTTDPFDVDARAGEHTTADQIPLMLRALLAERLNLQAHFETRELPVYALTIARKDGRLGAGLVPSTLDCEAVNAARQAGKTPDLKSGSGGPPCAWAVEYSANGLLVRFSGLSISRLTESLGQPDGRPIIDRTGLKGTWEFTLRYADPATPPADRTPADAPSLFTALQEQLGLELVPDRAPLQVLVIDHIERPSTN